MAPPRYQFARRIATGGMAEIILARETGRSDGDRLVVVKRILPHLCDDAEFVQMFQDEARLAASLRHPNIVQLFDVHRDAHDFFIVMEYLQGEDLRYALRVLREEERLAPTPIACRIIADAAAGLEYAHTARDLDGNPLSITHRDVAPSNVIVTYDGAVKLVDFGVAKASTNLVQTRPGTVKGKYAYISPEQIEHYALDARSDVFSLGVVLHELLTTHRLFKGASPAHVLRAVMEAEILPPSKLNHEVPEELDRVTLAALNRDRDKRIPSAGKLREYLEAVMRKYQWNVGAVDVADWMRESFPEHYETRLELERAVLAEARLPVHGEQEDPSLPPAFQTASGTRTPSSHRDAPGGTRPTVPLSPGVASAATPIEVLAPGASRGRIAAVSAIGTLAIVLLAGVAFWLGHRGGGTSPEPVAVATPPPSPTPVAPQMVGIFVQVVPSGPALEVDGRVFPDPVGPDGYLFSVPANADVTVVLRRVGYEDYREVIRAPSMGTANVYVTMRRLEPETLDEDTGDDVTEVIEEGGKPAQASPKRVVARRATRNGRAGSARTNYSTLLLEHEPQDAKLILDGKMIAGSSPRTLAEIAPGRHRLRVEAPGYAPVERMVKLRAGREHSFAFELRAVEAEPARIDVVSVPAGAFISVDGRPRGQAPLVGLQLAPGREYVIEAWLDGYRVWRTRISPTPGAQQLVTATLDVLEAAPRSAEAPAPTPTSLPEAASPTVTDVAVPIDIVGDVAAGRRFAVSVCGQCHGKAAPVLDSKRYTAAQWSRYFATGRHTRRAVLRPYVDPKRLADVKAYLMSTAADVKSATAAGVR